MVVGAQKGVVPGIPASVCFSEPVPESRHSRVFRAVVAAEHAPVGLEPVADDRHAARVAPGPGTWLASPEGRASTVGAPIVQNEVRQPWLSPCDRAI